MNVSLLSWEWSPLQARKHNSESFHFFGGECSGPRSTVWLPGYYNALHCAGCFLFRRALKNVLSVIRPAVSLPRLSNAIRWALCVRAELGGEYQWPSTVPFQIILLLIITLDAHRFLGWHWLAALHAKQSRYWEPGKHVFVPANYSALTLCFALNTVLRTPGGQLPGLFISWIWERPTAN